MTRLRRTRLGGTGGALAALLISAPACEAPPARAAAPAPTAWRSLGQWTGTGSRQTESFDVASGALRLQWAARPAAGAPGAPPGRFRVSLHSAISGRPLQVVVDSASPASGTAHPADDPRTSYLVIEADGVAWTAALDEAVASNTAGR
jgi:hypothetical protein